MKNLTYTLLIAALVFGTAACGGSDGDASGASDDGGEPAVGPIQQVELGPIDDQLAEEGKKIFETRCTVCHQLDEEYIGPALRDVTEQRDPVYVMNMILDPTTMVQKHPTAKELMAEYGTVMTDQNISEDEARALLEYLRQAAEETPEDSEEDSEADDDEESDESS